MKNTKKRATVILSIVLVLVLAIGGTIAYLAAGAGEHTNVFSFSDNIKGRLDEPNWKKEDGENLVPGMEIAKDPMVTNLSPNDIEVFTAIKVQFLDAAGTALSDADVARLLTLITIDWNTAEWTSIDGALGKNNEIRAYNTALKAGEVTNPLFSTITINGGISDADMAWLSGFSQEHDASCYNFGVHDNALCTMTYKHHKNCAIAAEAGASTTPKGGTTGGKTCDCTPAEVHVAACPSLKGTLSGTCGHTVAGAIGGFQLTVSGAILQADQFTSATHIDAVTAFKALLV